MGEAGPGHPARVLHVDVVNVGIVDGPVHPVLAGPLDYDAAHLRSVAVHATAALVEGDPVPVDQRD